jgi:hypothetical protein
VWVKRSVALLLEISRWTIWDRPWGAPRSPLPI